LAFARGALNLLGQLQATERDDPRDAKPGKILHELRLGELAHFKLVPHTPYYGTADATPLYLLTLFETWRWSGDRTLIDTHIDTAERCLDWIDQYGDRDGDGFQEYQTRAAKGYENMGWKDAGDAVLYPDGSLVKGPKALCELQGYVYAAWTGMADIFDVIGQPERAGALRNKAAALFEKFNAAFWDESWGGYAYALDGDKRAVVCESHAVLEHLEERYPEIPLLSSDPNERAEARRLSQWFGRQFDGEVNGFLLREKMEKRLLGLGSPDHSAMRAGREALRRHLRIIEDLLGVRNWLAGADLSIGDFAAAAHLSVIDYFGDVPWRDFPLTKTWYVRLKCRPCFRPLLADRWPGMVPAADYDNLDF
jgi:glutathione S-transferase